MSDDLILVGHGGSAAARRARPMLGDSRAFVAIALIVVVLWEGAKLVFQLPDRKLPHLGSILLEFGTRTQGGTGPLWGTLMLNNAAVTLGEALTGFILGGMLGCLLAVVFTASPLLERGLLPYVVGSQLVPILAVAPMVVIGMGHMGAPDWLSKAIIAAYLTFFPVTIGMLRGLRAGPPDALPLMRSYAASGSQIFWKLRLPASLPYLFTALKISATASIIGAIIGELPVGAERGIGVVVVNAAQYYNSRPQNLWAAVLVASLLGLSFYGAVVLAERLFVGRSAQN